MGGTADGKAAEGAFISEVFHNLSQPLTALHCGLELALQRDGSLEELRASVQTALDNTERLRQRLLLIRALNDPADIGDSSSLVDLAALLAELHEDLSPLFEAAGRKLEVRIACGPLLVRADKRRLGRALFVFVEYLYRYLPNRGVVALQLDGSGDRAALRITAASWLPVGPEPDSAAPACELELLRRTVVATAGEFTALCSAPGHGEWLATFPVA
jgi:signal transduction histidine kinase